MIQVLDWLFENELRAYPLKETSIRKSTSTDYVFDHRVILDAQFSFTTHPGDLNITQVTADATDVTFEFSSGADLTISKSVTTPYYHREESRLLVFGAGLSEIPTGTHVFSSLRFESSVIFEFSGPWKGVNSITFDSNPAVDGALTFIEGYQFELFSALQTVRFAVGSIYGKQIGCTQFSGYPDNCDEIISSINGIGPSGKKELFLKAGNGFVVWDDPENHRIYVGFAFTSGDDICGDIPPFPI